MTGRALRTACRLSAASERHLVRLAELERASGRGTERLLRVARTIADLDASAAVADIHLEEAARYRPSDTRSLAAEAG